MKTKTGGQIAGGLLTLAMLMFFLLAISLIVVKQGEAHQTSSAERTTPSTFAFGGSSAR